LSIAVVIQAKALISLLQEDRPGDIVLAWEALAACGARWVKKARTGAEAAGIDLSRHTKQRQE
jgi:hypothetical protein